MTEQQLRIALNRCDSLQEAFDFLQDNYRLDMVKPGLATKIVAVEGFIKLIKQYNPPVREAAKS
jgi:hypothetical protein